MKPLIGILCSAEDIPVPGWGVLPHQTVFQKYVDAVAKFAHCSPILIPTGWSDPEQLEMSLLNIVQRLNGILLPGGTSNIAAELYSDTLQHIGLRDPVRDAFALAIIRAVELTNTPLLGICRGMQEINVAFGGKLIPALHQSEGKMNHRSNPELPFEERYRSRHQVHFAENSWMTEAFSKLKKSNSEISVNSLHGQGIDTLGKNLKVDAFCEDGTIEAISHADEEISIFGVQWHPEWFVEECNLSQLVWQKFGKSCHDNLIRKINNH